MNGVPLKTARQHLQAIHGAGNVRTTDGVITVKVGDAWKRVGRVEDGLAYLRGRPSRLIGARPIQIWMDEASIRRAEIMGAGNISLGIRRALEQINE